MGLWTEGGLSPITIEEQLDMARRAGIVLPADLDQVSGEQLYEFKQKVVSFAFGKKDESINLNGLTVDQRVAFQVKVARMAEFLSNTD